MSTFRAQCEAILDAGEWPGDAQVAEEIGCSPHTAQGCRQQWQRENGKRHENGSGIMPRNVVEFIFDLRDDDELTFGEIAHLVNEIHGEYYGIHVNAGQCGNVYRQRGYAKPTLSRNIDPDSVIFPLETRTGIMYGPPIKAPHYPHKGVGRYRTACDYCPHRALCADPGAVCRCESAWVCEVIEC